MININIDDVWQLKALYSLSQEEIMNLLGDNQNLFTNSCPDICEIEQVLITALENK